MNTAVESLKGIARRAAAAVKAPTAAQQAGRAVEEAIKAIEAEQTRQADLVARAREDFDADPSDERADAVVQAEARSELQLRRRREALAKAQAELAAAEQAEREARLAELDATVKGLRDRVAPLAAEAVPHLRALLELSRQRDDLVRAAHIANSERLQLRNVDADTDRSHLHDLPIIAAGNSLETAILSAIGFADIERLRELLGGR